MCFQNTAAERHRISNTILKEKNWETGKGNRTQLSTKPRAQKKPSFIQYSNSRPTGVIESPSWRWWAPCYWGLAYMTSCVASSRGSLPRWPVPEALGISHPGLKSKETLCFELKEITACPLIGKGNQHPLWSLTDPQRLFFIFLQK